MSYIIYRLKRSNLAHIDQAFLSCSSLEVCTQLAYTTALSTDAYDSHQNWRMTPSSAEDPSRCFTFGLAIGKRRWPAGCCRSLEPSSRFGFESDL